MRPTPLFSNIQTGAATYDVADKATYKGIAIKTSILFLLTVASAVLTAIFLPILIQENTIVIFIVMAVSAAVLAFVSALVGRLSTSLAKVFSFIYSISIGFLLGVLTAILETAVPGIAFAAVFGTLVIFAVMLLLFFTGVIRPGRTLFAIMLGVLIGAGSLALLTLILAVFNRIDTQQYLFLLLAIEGLYLIYAVIMLTFNFLEAEAVVRGGAVKAAEWSVALGLMSTLAYIYVELLRILLIIAQLFGHSN